MKEIGQRLREARLASGFSLEDIADQTKIRMRYLESMEDGDFSSIPGIVYVKGFIKQYAQTVGLNPQELLDIYQRHIELTSPETAIKQEVKSVKPVVPAKGRKFNYKKFCVAAVFLVAIVFLAYKASGFVSILFNETLPQLREPDTVEDNSLSTNPEPTPTPGTQGTVDGTGTPGTAPAPTGSTTPDGSDAQSQDTLWDQQRQAQGIPAGTPQAPQGTVTQGQGNTGTVTQPQGTTNGTQGQSNTGYPTGKTQTQTGTTGSTTTGSNTNGAPTANPTTTPNTQSGTNYNQNTTGTQGTVNQGTGSTGYPNSTPNTQQQPVGQAPGFTTTMAPATVQNPGQGSQNLQIVVTEKSWIRVKADGKTVFEGNMDKGQTSAFSGTTFSVRAGNAGGVQVYFNGVAQGALGQRGAVTTRTFGE